MFIVWTNNRMKNGPDISQKYNISPKILFETFHFSVQVKEVIVKQDDLIAQIKSAKISRVKIEEPISYNIYTIPENPEPSTVALNDNFVHSLVFINALLRLESSAKDTQELISLCKKEYQGDKSQLNMMNEFNDKYTPDKAIWWYTRESFLYRMLNKALRERQNYIDLLLSFRFFISNIYEQLKQNQCKSSIRVYYGRIMLSHEIKDLEESQNQYLSINSFLLTNINRNKVLNFLKNSNIFHDQQQVLFIIDADANIVTKKPFADISKFSNFIDEGEILFMIGSVFRLMKVNKDGRIWVVRMQLCGDNEHDLEHVYESMNKIQDKNEDTKIDVRTFGEIMRRMGKYHLAEMIYRHFLAELSSDDSSLSDLHFAIGTVAKDKKEYDSSLKSYQKSLEIKKRQNPSDFITIGKLYGCIGDIHRIKENDKEAIKYFEKAIQSFERAHAKDHQHMADFYDNIGFIYKRQKKYNEALEYYTKALNIDSNCSSVAKSHNNIGVTYFLLNQYDLALKHYQLSLEIKLDTLPSHHLSIAKSYGNIGSVYRMTGDFNQALIYYQKAASIYKDLLPSQHKDVIAIEKEIQMCFKRTKINL